MDSRNRINIQLRGEALKYFQSRLKTDQSETDLINTLILEAKWYCEKPAEVESLGSKSADQLNSLSVSTAPPQPQQAQPPSVPVVTAKRSFLKDGFGAATLAYEKEKARQKARTEAMLDRKKQIEEFRKQAIADRHEQEYYYWQRKQKEKEKAQGQRGSSRIEGTQDHSYFTDGDWGAEA